MYNGQRKRRRCRSRPAARFVPPMKVLRRHLEPAAGAENPISISSTAPNMGKFNPNSNTNYQNSPASSPAASGPCRFYNDVSTTARRPAHPRLPVLKTPAAYSPVAQNQQQLRIPRPTPSISSNKGTNGIVWPENANPAVLHAYNAATLAELYNTNQLRGGDTSAPAINSSPLIINRKSLPRTTRVGVSPLH